MNTVLQVFMIMTQLLTFAIIGKVLLSWIIMSTRNETVMTIYRFLTQITEPILSPLRRIVPSIGMFDLTPLLAVILLQIISVILNEAIQ